MSRLRIRHETVYTYSEPVEFGAWKLLIRPHDTHGSRLIKASLELSPPGDTRWTYDAYGNSICHYTPYGPSDHLRVVNHLVVDRFPAPLAPLAINDPGSTAPIVYEQRDRDALDPFIRPATDDRDGAYMAWLQSQVGAPNEPVLDFLQRVNETIHRDFTYAAREAVGTLSPSETVAGMSGTCRDFAWLMIESLRRLGFAARFVTGYLYSSRLAQSSVRGAGASHAWCEVFLPDLGWVEFDPTNGLAESEDLIRVAATRTPQEASIMDGPVFGQATYEMTVAVDVDLVDENGVALAA